MGMQAAVAAGVFAAAAVAVRLDTRVARRLPGTGSDADASGSRSGPLIRIGSSRMARLVGREAEVARRLAAAGSDRSAAEVVGAKIVAAVAVIALAVLAGAPPIVLTPLLVSTIVVPDFLLGRAARRRRAAADASLPELLDLLAAGSAAGLAAPLAFRRAAAALRGPLAEEAMTVVRAVDLGARWRDELGAMADRLDLRDLRRAVAAIARSERLGSSLATTLRDLADEVRRDRRARATERARTAPVKMLFPLVFLILPAFLLLTVVPVLVATLHSIG
jgi:tight adherence protein C